MTTTEAPTTGLRRRRVVIGGVVVALVALLVGGWWWSTSRALDQVGAPFSTIECSGTRPTDADVVVVRRGVSCVLGTGVAYDGRLPVHVERVFTPYGDATPVRSVASAGRTPSGGAYRVDERLRNDASGYRIYRVTLVANDEVCFPRGAVIGSDWPEVEVSVLGRHRTISAERSIELHGSGSRADC